MTEITVSTSELDAAAASIHRVGDQVQQSATMQSPDPSMLGIFMLPFMSVALPAVTGGLGGILKGCGKGYEVIGDRLKDNAKAYADFEHAAVEAAKATVVGLP